MKTLLIGLIAIIPSLAFAVNLNKELNFQSLPVKFENTTQFDLKINPMTDGCLSFDPFTVNANSSKTINGHGSSCPVIFVTATDFYIVPITQNTDWKSKKDKAKINFTCGYDIGGCSSEMDDFPIKLKNKKGDNVVNLHAADVTNYKDPNPFTFRITEQGE